MRKQAGETLNHLYQNRLIFGEGVYQHCAIHAIAGARSPQPSATRGRRLSSVWSRVRDRKNGGGGREILQRQATAQRLRLLVRCCLLYRWWIVRKRVCQGRGRAMRTSPSRGKLGFHSDQPPVKIRRGALPALHESEPPRKRSKSSTSIAPESPLTSRTPTLSTSIASACGASVVA